MVISIEGATTLPDLKAHFHVHLYQNPINIALSLYKRTVFTYREGIVFGVFISEAFCSKFLHSGRVSKRNRQ